MSSLLFLLFISAAIQQTEANGHVSDDVCETSSGHSIDIHPRILGGRTASNEELPWMFNLSIYNSQTPQPVEYCSAFLIHSHWALTAAHCLQGAEVVTVTGGYSKDELNASIPALVKNVSSEFFYIHPDYSNFVENDIALIYLVEAVKNINSIRPLCLLGSNDCHLFPRLQSLDAVNCRRRSQR